MNRLSLYAEYTLHFETSLLLLKLRIKFDIFINLFYFLFIYLTVQIIALFYKRTLLN